MDFFGGATEGLLSATDAERIIRGLRPFPIAEIGTPSWMQQLGDTEKLNVQAHHSIMTKSEEFVKESLVAHDKLPVLLEELLAVELWRAEVLPRVRDRLLGLRHAVLKAHFVARHEVTILTLLEAVLYHSDSLQSLGDALLELLDYCFRKLTWLGANLADVQARVFAATSETSAAREKSSAEELADWLAKIDFNAALFVLGVVRFVTEHIAQLPLAVVNKLLKDNDMPSALAACILAAPWRRKQGGKIYAYDLSQQRWQPLPPGDARAHDREVQCWLAVNNLLVDEACRNKYFISSHTKALLLKLKPLLQETLIDQTVVLVDLQRFLENLTMFDPPAPTDKASAFLIEQIPEIRTRLLRTNWEDTAKRQYAILSAEIDRDAEIRRLAEAFAYTGVQDLIDKPKCAKCGQPAPKRCSRCQNEWYCSKEHQAECWPRHKPICAIIAQNPKPATGK